MKHCEVSSIGQSHFEGPTKCRHKVDSIIGDTIKHNLLAEQKGTESHLEVLVLQ